MTRKKRVSASERAKAWNKIKSKANCFAFF